MPRHPATLARATILVAAIVGAVVAAGLPVAAQAPSPVPEPILVVDGGAADDQVGLAPATQAVSGDRVAWLLTNGGSGSLMFDLAVHDVTTRDGDVEIGAPRDDLPLALDTLHLGPGDVGRIPLRLPDGAPPGTIALIARTVDADPETTVSGVALLGADGEVVPRVAGSDADAGTFTVRLDSEAPALVDVAVQTSVWPGMLAAEDLVEGVLVPAGGRDLDIALQGTVAGRVHIDVAVSGTTAERASGDVWWWPAEVVVTLLAVLLLLVLVVSWVWRRRRR